LYELVGSGYAVDFAAARISRVHAVECRDGSVESGARSHVSLDLARSRYLTK
jgi:hypothetical protein